MKKILLLAAIGSIAFFVSARNHSGNMPASAFQNDTPRMKQYWLVKLLKGPAAHALFESR